MAEALLGRRVRHPRRRHRPRLPAPRERGGADARRRAARPLARHLDAQRHARGRRAARRWPSRSATSAASATCSTTSAASALLLYFSRRPLPAADRVLAGERLEAAAGGVAADPRGRAAPGRRATRRPSWRRTATRSSTPSPTTSTPPRRSPRCTSGSARRTSSRARGDAHLREMLGVLGPRVAARGARRARRAEAVALAERRDAARARRGLGARPTACATSCATMGWEVRDGPQGPELVPAS